MSEEKEPTRRELAEALTRSSAALETANAQVAALQTEVARLKAPVQAPPVPEKVPYTGLVRAKENCWVGQYRYGPQHYTVDGKPRTIEGEVFHVDGLVLWSDDPFEAVRQIGEKDDGSPRVELNPDAPRPIPFQLRQRTSEALAGISMTPQRANDWMPGSVALSPR